MKVVKIAVGIICILAVLTVTGTFLYLKDQTRPFPLEALKVFDASLDGYWESGKVRAFRARVKNEGDSQVSSVSFRIDFFDSNGMPIDGVDVTVYKRIPPGSTRLVENYFLGIHNLPRKDQWTWSYRLTRARETGIFG